MSNIENELRRLGERVRDEGSGDGGLPPRQRRRIKVRRAVFATASAVTAVALIATVSYGLDLVREGSDIAPAEDASSTLIRFDRSGGFTGDHYVLTVQGNGSAVLEFPGSRGLVDPEEFEVHPDALSRLRVAVDQVEWTGLERRYRGTIPGVGVADGHVYEIEHRGYVVEMESGLEPRSMRPLVDLLNGILEGRLRGPITGEPSLSLSETSVRPGDVVELGIQARDTYIWGVLTSLETERDGTWRRVAYWRTWQGRGPRILEAITSRGGTIESIGFSGGASFKLEVPQLEPGIYRITKDFNLDGTAPVEERTVLAEVRFEVVSDGSSASEEDFAAIWPEDNADDADRDCSTPQSFRSDPDSVVAAFGGSVLGWDEVTVIGWNAIASDDRTGQPSSDEGRSFELRRKGSRGRSPRNPAVLVNAVEVLDGCWSVASVSRMPDREPTGLSISVRGPDVEVAFATLAATEAVVEVGYGQDVKRQVWVEAQGAEMPVGLRLDSPPATTGHFLILFKDEEGKVFSAAGSPLPKGDFAAG